jgi:hypothetical protein
VSARRTRAARRCAGARKTRRPAEDGGGACLHSTGTSLTSPRTEWMDRDGDTSRGRFSARRPRAHSDGAKVGCLLVVCGGRRIVKGGAVN